MKAKELAEKLLKHPEIEVMIYQPCSNPDSIVMVREVELRVAEEDEFDEDWNMPKGFTFLHLQ